MTDAITKAMVEAYRDEHDSSLSSAMQALKHRQKLARRAQLQEKIEAATTVDELKPLMVEMLFMIDL